jgi:hypothetical protein
LGALLKSPVLPLAAPLWPAHGPRYLPQKPPDWPLQQPAPELEQALARELARQAFVPHQQLL